MVKGLETCARGGKAKKKRTYPKRNVLSPGSNERKEKRKVETRCILGPGGGDG